MGGATGVLLTALWLAACVQGIRIRQPDIYSLRVFSEVRNRYAKTLMTTRVANPARRAQEVVFSAVLPDKAFVSGFVIEMDGKTYHALVHGKEEALKEYQTALSRGRGAAHVAVSARDSNVVQVSVNLEAQSKVTFNLTYEELLQRESGVYNLRINISPAQVVKELSVEVRIDEQAPLRLVQVPNMQSGNEISDGLDNTTDPLALIERPTPFSAVVRLAPTKDEQRQRGELGISGQLLVRYDVDRDASPNQILVSDDGYFVHFYSPPGLTTLPKHVIFVLDVSGSMYGRKIEQLKAAMHAILDELNEGDIFTLIPFASEVKVWQPDKPLTWSSLEEERLTPEAVENAIVAATSENIAKAKSSVESFMALGVTHMYEALEAALRVSEAAMAADGHGHAPMLVLLTDGEPNGRISNTDEIVRLTTERNQEVGAAVFTLAFGRGADYSFLRRLALRNGGIGKLIYEAGDAHLQLRNFYRQIASPLLAGVTFRYDFDKVDASSLTTVSFTSLFRGGELVVAGRLLDDGRSPSAAPWYLLESSSGNANTAEVAVAPASSSERLWAYLTVRQLLDRYAADRDHALRVKAKEIALRYSFVTEVTSLVVVKPNETSVSNMEPPSVVRTVPYPPKGRGNANAVVAADDAMNMDKGMYMDMDVRRYIDHSSVVSTSPPNWLHSVSMALAVLIVLAFK